MQYHNWEIAIDKIHQSFSYFATSFTCAPLCVCFILCSFIICVDSWETRTTRHRTAQSQRFLMPPSYSYIHFNSFLQPLVTTNLFSISRIFSLQEIYTNGIMSYLIVSDCLVFTQHSSLERHASYCVYQ